jgi:UPF0755 protein
VTHELGLHFEPGEDGPRDAGPSYTRRRIAFAGILIVVVLVVVGVAIGGVKLFTHFLGAPPDYQGDGYGSVIVQVHPGDSLTQIGERLDAAGVVRSSGAFTDAASNNDRAASIGPGYYRLHKHMQASLALSLLLNPSSLVQSRVTIPEGRRLRDILAQVAQDTNISSAALAAAAKAPSKLGVPAWGAGHPLEGFLFPATYDFGPDTTATQALSAMVSRFNQEAASLGLVAGAKARGMTPYQILTLASIIEREGRLTSDFPKIAEVFFNRLHRGMPLGSDATLYYVLPPNHGQLTQSELKIDSPYNTRLHTGLPPTPIASPGEAALRAALHPAKGPYLYFVTIDQAGHAAFATTLDEFNRLVAESRRNGVR